MKITLQQLQVLLTIIAFDRTHPLDRTADWGEERQDRRQAASAEAEQVRWAQARSCTSVRSCTASGRRPYMDGLVELPGRRTEIKKTSRTDFSKFDLQRNSISCRAKKDICPFVLSIWYVTISASWFAGCFEKSDQKAHWILKEATHQQSRWQFEYDRVLSCVKIQGNF